MDKSPLGGEVYECPKEAKDKPCSINPNISSDDWVFLREYCLHIKSGR